MEKINSPSKTHYNVDMDLCFICAACNFMTNSTEHLEKHTTTMHHGMPPKFITKIISESDYTSTKQADSLSALTHVDETAGGNFPTGDRDDIPPHSDSTLKLEYIDDDDIKVDSNELKPIVKDLSNMLSKVSDTFNSFNSIFVKTEVEPDDKLSSDINQITIKKETLSPSLSNFEVKGEIMHCQSCSYNDNDLGKLKSHKFTQHPTEAAVITNYLGETDLHKHDIKFLCIKETCSFSTVLCNVYEQHLLRCCSINQTMTRIETERLKSTITFVFDLHNKLGLDTVSDFLDFVSSFNKTPTSRADQEKFIENLECGNSGSMLSTGKSALLSDVNACLSCDDEERNSERAPSSVPGTVVLVNRQKTDLTSEFGQTETMCLEKTDKCNEHLIKTDSCITNFLSSSKGEVINIESGIDHLVYNNVELEIETAGKPLYDNNTLFSEEIRKDSIQDKGNIGAKCDKTGMILVQESNLLKHTGTHGEEKGSGHVECTERFDANNISLTSLRKHKEKRKFKCSECGRGFKSKNSFTEHMRVHIVEKPFKCNECGKGFRQKIGLTAHMIVHTGEQTFKCNECGKRFSQKRNLTKHMIIHTGEKPFKCNECGKGFPQKRNLSKHMNIHTGEKPLKCNVCGKRFSQKRNLSKHMNIHAGEKPFKCNECGKGFRRKRYLAKHIKTHTGEKPFMCSECGKRFTQKRNLTKHMTNHTGEKPFKCIDCGKGFSEKGSLAVHMNVHTEKKPFKCTECGKGFGEKRSLMLHMSVHTGEKPFKCNGCGKCFRVKGSLTLHMRIHTGVKSFKCNECGEGFSQKSNLTKHMQIHTGEKPFKCSDCGNSFRQKSSLIIHMRVHSGEKPYKCIECGKDFSQKIGLTVHMRVHTREKPYKCIECGSGFSTNGSLSVHMRVHTREKPYKCIECGKDFSEKGNLTIHLSVHTGEKPFKCNECGKGFSQKNSLIMHRKVHTREKLSGVVV